MSEKYKVGESAIPHFMTITVIDWVDLFTRQEFRDILIESLKYCIENRGLSLNAYCIMSNHIHLIASSQNSDLNFIIRDFKKHTSKQLITAINKTNESRKVWLLKKFKFAADRVKRGRNYKIWKDGFHPVELNTNMMLEERLDYVHNNPVDAGIVWSPEDYVYSSASNYQGKETILKVEFL